MTKLAMPAGKYFIGDLRDIFTSQNMSLIDYETNHGTDEGIFEVYDIIGRDGLIEFAIFSAPDSGRYTDNRGNEYETSTGSIACISVKYVENPKDVSDNIFDFSEEFYVESRNDKIMFGDIIIDISLEEDRSLDKYYDDDQ